MVVASAFAFLEIARQWDRIARSRFTLDQFYTFVHAPPAWFDIAPVDEDLLPDYARVPRSVFIHGREEPIEWTDAIHVATLYSRGEAALLATTDHRIEVLIGSDRLAR